ncbi:MAG TPA: non-homologous end-joining DNA ligase [Chloroflexota bacterium]|nr:non-homologous end-joining DNA ligase [Chloroflexota bacterium]
MTRPEKILFPKQQLTKRDLAAYYVAMAPYLLPFLRDRPLMMKQYPNGVEGRFFFRQDAPPHTPAWFATFRGRAASVGHDVDFLVADDVRSLVWLANQAAIELHTQLARTAHIDEPDLMVLDLDPGAELGLDAAREVALLARELLARDGVESFAKLSGKRGIHVCVPLAPGQSFARSHDYAGRIAGELARARPKLVTADYLRKEARTDRVLVDVAGNARGKVMTAPYSARPTPEATVSMPLPWSRFERGTPDRRAFTIETVPGWVKEHGDVLGEAMGRGQTLPTA